MMAFALQADQVRRKESMKTGTAVEMLMAQSPQVRCLCLKHTQSMDQLRQLITGHIPAPQDQAIYGQRWMALSAGEKQILYGTTHHDLSERAIEISSIQAIRLIWLDDDKLLPGKNFQSAPFRFGQLVRQLLVGSSSFWLISFA
jgi:hypothetical protein